MATSNTELVMCRWCAGDGQVQVDGEAWAPCHFCDGEGKGKPCPTCRGDGAIYSVKRSTPWLACGECAGSGIAQAEREEPVALPWLTSITVERKHLEIVAKESNALWDDLMLRSMESSSGLFLPFETLIALRAATNAALGIPTCAACGVTNGGHSALCERKR